MVRAVRPLPFQSLRLVFLVDRGLVCVQVSILLSTAAVHAQKQRFCFAGEQPVNGFFRLQLLMELAVSVGFDFSESKVVGLVELARVYQHFGPLVA